MSKDLLFEVGAEEIPSGYVPPALDQLREVRPPNILKKLRLDHGEITVLGTCRRLALHVKDMAEHQTDESAMILGPSAKAAFDAEGRPTKAAQGFARGRE